MLIIFANNKNTAFHCMFMLVHSALTDGNKHNFWFQ